MTKYDRPVRCLASTAMALAVALSTACGSSSAETDAGAGAPDARITGYKLTLSWADNADNEEGFAIERALESDGAFTEVTRVGVDVEAYQDLTVDLGTSYCYRVRAYNSAGDSAFTNEACGTPTADGMARLRVR